MPPGNLCCMLASSLVCLFRAPLQLKTHEKPIFRRQVQGLNLSPGLVPFISWLELPQLLAWFVSIVFQGYLPAISISRLVVSSPFQDWSLILSPGPGINNRVLSRSLGLVVMPVQYQIK